MESIFPWDEAFFLGGGWRAIVKCGDTLDCPIRRGNFCWKGHARRHSTVSCAKWLNQPRCRLVVDSAGPTEACTSWGAHWRWRHLANAIEPSMCTVDAAFLSNYFDQLLLLLLTFLVTTNTSRGSDVISSYHIYAICFLPFSGAALLNICYCDITFVVT